MKKGICMMLAATLLCVCIAGCSAPSQDETHFTSNHSQSSSQNHSYQSSSSVQEAPIWDEQALKNISPYFSQSDNLERTPAFFTPQPLDTEQIVPIKALAWYYIENESPYYSFAEAQIVFPAFPNATVQTSALHTGFVTLTIGQTVFWVSLLEDKQQDLIKDILGVPCFEKDKITDISALLGRPSAKIQLKGNSSFRFILSPLTPEDTDSYTYHYFTSFGEHVLWVRTNVYNALPHLEDYKQLESLLSLVQLQAVFDNTPDNFDPFVKVMQDQNVYPGMPTEPDEGPVTITVDVFDKLTMQNSNEHIRLQIGDMQNFALMEGGFFTAFDKEGERIVIPNTDLLDKSPQNGKDPVLSISVSKGPYQVAKAIKDTEEYQTFCQYEFISGQLIDRTTDLGRPALSTVGGWGMTSAARSNDNPYLPGMPYIYEYHYYLDFGEYTLSAYLTIPRPSYYRYGELPAQLVESCEKLLKSITLA